MARSKKAGRCSWSATPLLLLGVFAPALDRRHLELDLWGQPRARWFAALGAATLVVGTTLSYLAGQAFEARYSVIVFPFFVLLVALGITAFADSRVCMAVLVVVVGLGLVGGVRNATEQRTQAGEVGAILTAEAQPGDLVVYCPDQLGPSVHRLAPERPRRSDVSAISHHRRSLTGSTTRNASTPPIRSRSPVQSSPAPETTRSGS